MISTQALLTSLKNEMARKKTSGNITLSLLDTVENLLSSKAGLSLDKAISQPDHVCRILADHFRSPLACHQHTRAVISALKSMGKQVPREVSQHWYDALKVLDEKCTKVRGQIEALFRLCEASENTVKGYVTETMHILAKLNSASIHEVLAKPEVYETELRIMCDCPGTEADHIKKIMCIFKCNPTLQIQHPTAFRSWQCASSEHRARQMQEARKNAPSNARQAENFVPMAEWRQKLEDMKSQPHPSDARKRLHNSMVKVLMAYACTMPPKRAEVGGLRVFSTDPTLDENHIVLDAALMRVTKHKTSKHAAHAHGIEESLSAEFMHVLEESMEAFPRTHLFVDSNGHALTPQGFSKWVIRSTEVLFDGKAPGVSLLRHAFCTYLDFNKLTGVEKDEIAARMGHSAKQQEMYRFIDLRPLHT